MLVVLELLVVLSVEGAQSAELLRVAECVNAQKVPGDRWDNNPQCEALVLTYTWKINKIFIFTANLSQLVTGSTKGGKEEQRVPATLSSKVTLAIDISAVANAIHTLSMDQLVVLECHILCIFNIIKEINSLI